MNVSPEHEADLLSMSDDRKWKLIRNDVRPSVGHFPPSLCHSPRHLTSAPYFFLLSIPQQAQKRVALPTEYFLEQMQRHLDPDTRYEMSPRPRPLTRLLFAGAFLPLPRFAACTSNVYPCPPLPPCVATLKR
jgi:hypothetical protein